MNSKTIKSLLLTALCLLMATPSIQADFWKSLKKAAQTGQDVLDQLSGTKDDQSSPSKSTASDNGNHGELPGMTIKLLSCQRWGNGVKIIYSLSNKTDSDRKLKFYFYGNPISITPLDPVIYDANDNRYTGGPVSLGEASYEKILGFMYANIPDGIVAKGEYMVYNVPKNIDHFRCVTIGIHDQTAGGRGLPYEYKWQNIPITEIRNTDSDKVICTLPTFTINYKGLRRDGKNVFLDFTITNNTGHDLSPYGLALKSSYSAFSHEGDAFSVAWLIGGESPLNAKEIPVGVPVKCSLLIKNVPASVTGFSLVRFLLQDNTYKIEFRDIDITE